MSDLAVQNRESEQEVMPSFDFLLERETERNTLLAEHRAWLKEIKRERPLPKTHYRVAVYIRYFNQTRYEDYLSAHKKQFLDTLALCPNWKFVGFYVDEGSTAPNMESAPEWSRLLQDCYDEKVDLIITQKASNISKKLSELSFCTRLLALRTLFLYAPLGSTPKASGRLLRFGGYLYAGFLLSRGSTRPVLFAKSRLEDTP